MYFFLFYLFIYLFVAFVFAFSLSLSTVSISFFFSLSSLSNCYSAMLSFLFELSRVICILFLFSHFKSLVLTYSSAFSFSFSFFLLFICIFLSIWCSLRFLPSLSLFLALFVSVFWYKIFTMFSIYGNSWFDISTHCAATASTFHQNRYLIERARL